MKKYIPRLIAWGILVLIGAVVVLSSFSTDLLIVEAAVLALLATAVFLGKRHSMILDTPWFVAGALLLAVVIPNFMSTPATVMKVCERMFDALDKFRSSPLFSMGFVALLGTQIFLRKSSKIFVIVLRYVAMGLFLQGVGEGLMASGDMVSLPAITIIPLSASYEIQTAMNGEHRRRTLSCIFSTLGCYAVARLFGLGGVRLIVSLFTFTDYWLYVIIGAAVLGGLMILEEYYNQERRGEAPSVHADLGGVLLFWSLLCLIMKLWGATMHWFVLVPGMISAYFCYGLFMRKWRKRGNRDELKIFLIVWSLIVLGALVFGRSLNTSGLVASVLAVLLAAAAACWGVSSRKQTEWLIMTSYLGVAAVVLLTATLGPDLSDMVGLAKTILCVAMLSVSWCVLCSTTAKLNRLATDIYANEFRLAQKLESYAPVVIIAIAVIRALFV